MHSPFVSLASPFDLPFGKPEVSSKAGATVVGQTTAVVPAASLGNTHSVALPSTQEGDVVVVAIGSDVRVDPNTTVQNGIASADWTELYTTSDTQPGTYAAYKVMGSTPDTSVDIYQVIGGQQAVAIQAYRGLDTAALIDVAVASSGGTGSDMNPTTRTSVTDGALHIAIGIMDDDAATSVTPPTGFTNDTWIATTGAAGTNATVAIASFVAETAGAVDPSPFLTDANDRWRCLHFAFKPVVAPVASGALGDQDLLVSMGNVTVDVSGDFTGGGHTYSVNTVTGVSIDSSTGVVTFATDSMAVQLGTTIVVAATNSGGTANSAFTLNVRTPRVVPIYGQSNPIGFDDFDGGADHPAGTYQYDQSNNLVAATTMLDFNVPQPGKFGPSIEIAIAHRASNPTEAIVFVPRAIGGTGFSTGEWLVPSGSLYTDLVADTNALFTAYPTFNLLYFHNQFGEQDWNDSTNLTTFETELTNLLDALRENITVADINTPVVLVGITTGGQPYADAIENVADALERTVYVDMSGYTTFDGVHWDAASIRASGTDSYNASLTAASDFQVPTVTGASTDTDGNTITLTVSETVTFSEDTGDWTFSGIAAGTPTVTSVTGSGTTSIIVEISGNLVANGDTVTIAYTNTDSDVRDVNGNPMADFSGQNVVNNVPGAYTIATDNDAILWRNPDNVITSGGGTVLDAWPNSAATGSADWDLDTVPTGETAPTWDPVNKKATNSTGTQSLISGAVASPFTAANLAANTYSWFVVADITNAGVACSLSSPTGTFYDHVSGIGLNGGASPRTGLIGLNGSFGQRAFGSLKDAFVTLNNTISGGKQILELRFNDTTANFYVDGRLEWTQSVTINTNTVHQAIYDYHAGIFALATPTSADGSRHGDGDVYEALLTTADSVSADLARAELATRHGITLV